MAKKPHPNWSPELAASVAAIEAKGDPKERRVLIGWRPCPWKCGSREAIYDGDPRARGMFRVECEDKKCGRWGDLDAVSLADIPGFVAAAKKEADRG